MNPVVELSWSARDLMHILKIIFETFMCSNLVRLDALHNMLGNLITFLLCVCKHCLL